MTHDEAAETKATERYLLREMTLEEMEAFEQHYFDCPTCTEDVRVGQTFVADLKVVFRDNERRSAIRAGLAGFLLGLGLGICLRPNRPGR